MRVAGVDPSITRTGIARDDLVTSVRGYSLPVSATVDDRARRLVDIATATLRFLRPADVDLVVIEGYSLGGARGLAAAYLAELGGLIRAELSSSGIALLEVPPTSLKKWATGNGRSDKDTMRAAAVDRGAPGNVNHDEADAYLLRLFGIHTQGGPT